jgi:hypothetical protein
MITGAHQNEAKNGSQRRMVFSLLPSRLAGCCVDAMWFISLLDRSMLEFYILCDEAFRR